MIITSIQFATIRDMLKSNFLSLTAHQLKTPLGSMRWNLETLIDGIAGEMSPEAKEILQDIYESNARMNNLVNGLLNVSRIDEGCISNNPKPTDLIKIIDNTLKDFSHLIKFKHLRLFFIKPTKPVILDLDPTHLKEIIENLLSNAIKYNKDHGALKIELTKATDFVTLKLTDTGIGIPKNDHQKLFSKFFRAHNAVTSNREGTGLGLFVVKEYLARWNGNIRIESIEGQGTIITLKIPTNI